MRIKSMISSARQESFYCTIKISSANTPVLLLSGFQSHYFKKANSVVKGFVHLKGFDPKTHFLLIKLC